MPGLIIGGREVEVPGVVVRNYKDDPKIALRVGRPDGNNDGKKRTMPVSLVVVHTTKGIPGGSDKRPQVILPGLGPDTDAGDRTARYWSTDPTPSGAHIVIDHNGQVDCLADCRDVAAYHAGNSVVNQRSIGIELYQGGKAELYQGQLDVCLKVIDVLTAEFGIQRQIPDAYRNRPVPRLDDGGGKDLVGVVGHRDVSDNRGKGDPGDAIMDTLADGGYERFDMFTSKDREEWKKRQAIIRDKTGLEIDIDGIPGAQTKAALLQMGHQYGLWALPPKEDSGYGLLEALLEGFFPTFLAALGGDRNKTLDVISAWAKNRKLGS